MQSLYSRLCDGDWEHTYGFKVGTLDNPGWHIDFDVADTKLQIAEFTPIEIERTETDWIHCRVKDRKFVGYCGPLNLDELFRIFREWAEIQIGPGESPWMDMK